MSRPSTLQVSPAAPAACAADAGEGPATSRRAAEQQEKLEKSILLLGDLNVGKTTLFNRVCGKRLKVANYPGTSISIGRGSVTETGAEFQLIDTPGINSMMLESEHERISRDILLDEKPDIIALVADGKNLRKSLLLTLQLAEYETSLLLNINMMDEVRQRGIRIETERLAALLGVPVTATVATEGEGVGSFRRALAGAQPPRLSVSYPVRVESAISIAAKLLRNSDLPARAVGVALLAGDEDVKRYVGAKCGEDIVEQIEKILNTVQADFNRPLSAVILEARLRVVDRVLSEVQSISPPARMPFSEKIGEWSRRPLTGIPIAALVVFLMYLFVGQFGAQTLVGVFEGQLFGEWLVPLTERLLAWIPSQFVTDVFVGEFGLVSVGLTLAFGIVIPVLATFFFAFAILEDSGYLPRLSILLDRILRQIGLNGKGIVPLVMGFSCITMAILTTRILETKRERLIATCLLVLGIPCAPVLAVMLVLLGGMSIWASVTVFGLIAVQLTVIGLILGRIMPGRRSDFILELPPIRIPRFRSLINKTGGRLWWFIKEALPLFLLATFVLFLLEKVGVLALLERAAQPVLTGFLGLPPESVQVAIMKLIRKESAGALLSQLSDAGLFDNVQIVVSLLLLTFLFPCLNSILVMVKERGLRGTVSIIAFVSSYALVVGATVNWICRTFGVSFK
ncbi:MAG TPA: ferrous iron transport protein B [Terriglobia bacterium]|nr:ferrous iron transport protein B [Terriglobia bacterium]